MSNHNYFFYNDSNPSFTPYSTIYNDVSLISINWIDILSKPSFSNICFTANYYDLSNIPNLSVYASNSDVSNISNILFLNSSNSNINSSNSIYTTTNNLIGNIKTSQWNTISSNIYYNDGNVGIGSSVFNGDKLIVVGNINSDEYKIKELNISNIFITSNIFENRSNNLFSNLSNQDYISSITPVVSSQWITDANSNIYYLGGSVGIGTSTFNSDTLIINGSINTTELKLKGNNISNIFITSNIFENRSNLIISNTSNTFFNFTSNQFSTNGSNIFFNLTGNVGIGSSVPKEKLDINGNININGNILPNTCNTFDLGSSNFKWRDIYLSGNSIHLDNVNINSSNNLLNIKDDNTGLLLGINVNEIRLNSNNKIGGIQIDTNGDLKINNKFLVGIDNNYDYSNIIFSNVFSNSSNFLNNSILDKYNSLNTDTIAIGTSNRFITNDIYNRNINFTGILTASNIITSNLSVIGDTSVFNTTIYQTEQLQIVNDTTATAMIVKQINSSNNICEFYYNNNQLGLVINSNGNIGIGVTNPTQKLDVLGTINTSGMNIGGLDLITLINSNDTYTSNITITNVSNINYSNSNIIFNYTSNSSNSLFINKQNILTSSSILLGYGSNITNIDYNSLSNKPDLSVYTTTTSLNTTSNNIYSNLSNIDYGFSNSNYSYSSNRITGIITNNYQWTTTGNNIYLNVSGNVGIGSTIPTEKLDINGNINTSEILIKKSNISNIFITSNVFENRSNISYSNLSNLDFISSNNCILYTNNKTSGLTIGGGSSSSYWIQTGTSNVYTTCNIGIGTTNPLSKLDILGDINYTGSLKMNNLTIPFSTLSNTNVIATNASFSNVNNSYGYYMFLNSGTIYFPQATNCDVLLIGAGGNGGITGGGGGGGSGELIYYPNYPFNVGTSNIQIGYSSFNANNRITKISSNSIDYIIAKGGGDGGILNQYGTIGGSGGGSYLNTNNQALAGTKWNSTYSYLTTGNNGTSTQGGSGGSVLVSGAYTETITNTNLIIGSGGSGSTTTSIPTLKTTYGSGGDGNGGLGTQGLAIIKVPLNIQQPIFNGYVYYSNITNKPILNDIVLSSNIITSNYNNQLNFPYGNVSWGNEWFLYIGTSPTSVINSFIFQHLTSTINSKWWFNGTTTSTNAEISDERIKKEIQDIPNSLDKLMLLKPKEYYLCDEKDYLKKYGIIAQEVNDNEDLNHLVFNDEDYIANIYLYASFIRENNKYKLITNSSIINKINIDDELKLLLNNTNNIEIIIEDSPYHNRYKKRYVKVKSIIDETTFEIYEDIELNNNEMNNIFIYGKKVKDFKKLDYSSLYSLNIKATQELYKLIQHQQSIIENLQLRIIELENKI